MLRILAICLGHEEKLIGNYKTLQDLKDALIEKYAKYLVKEDVKKTRANIILTYMDKSEEKLLEDISVIKNHDADQWFQLSIKRIWDACCQCLASYTITPGQIPCECQNPKCDYQYCTDCVEIMKRVKPENELIRCMYCGHSSAEGPKQNKFLLDLLWKQYAIKYGVESIPTMDIIPGVLSNDIECRVIHLKSLIQTLRNKINPNESIDSEIKRANILIEQLEKIKEKTGQLLLTDIDDDDDNDDGTMNNYLNEYIERLTGNNNRKCEDFISICEQLLYYDQKIEFEKYFPILNNKMNDWEHLLNTQEQFRPKIIEAFKAVETDLGHHIIPNIPCRIGCIGDTSVGKSSLINWLREIENKSTKNNLLISPVRVNKSTYCRLEFEYEYNNGQKIIFVDIEGSTDTDIYLKSANYFDEILRADCDIYLILSDNQFTDIHHGWYEFIVGILERKCWFIRSKIDKLFCDIFKEIIHQDFNSVDDRIKNKYSKKVFEETQRKVNLDIHGKILPNIYLTFTLHDENLNKILYPLSDMERLAKDLQNLPPSLHGKRLQKMALCAMARVVNTCFRRGYVVNIMKYKIAAGFAAIGPFCDLIVRYYGREEIRQAFGVNTNSRLMNYFRGTKDELKEYLEEFNIIVDEFTFKTSAFNKTFKKTSIHAKEHASNVTSIAVKGATAMGVAGVSLSDDIVRVTGVGAINTIRGLSVSLIVVGGILTAGMCAWAAVSNGKQMYSYLNRLCDDLITVSDYVTIKMIENNDTVRDQFSETK